ncbi:MAG: hypothetical protein HY840_09975 [Bacteroidetes bacterium]|nr:hypothetical protein [Bacteroidota bacterium]
MKTLFTVTFALTVATIFGQTTTTPKTVIVTKYSKTVPTGKKWILEVGKTTKVQVTDEVLTSGDMCNAMFLSNHRMITSINRGDIYKNEGFGIILKNPEKVPYTNDYTYELTPISFVDKTFSVYDFQNKKPEEVGVKKLIFKAGENVFVGNCLESIEMIEVNMTAQELADEKKKQGEEIKLKSAKAKNYCIPIDPEKYVAKGTKPILKDSLIKYVIFESPVVVFRKRNQKGGYDNVHHWALSLTQNEFIMETSGMEEKYSVLGAKYDDQLHMQEFQLADETGQFTHKLNLCYSNSSNEYRVLFSSIDNKDDYQFQSVTIKDKQLQTK